MKLICIFVRGKIQKIDYLIEEKIVKPTNVNRRLLFIPHIDGKSYYLLDIELEDMNGLELAKQIRSNKQAEIIFITAHKKYNQRTVESIRRTNCWYWCTNRSSTKTKTPIRFTNYKNEEPQTTEEAIFSQAGSLEQSKTLHRIDRSLTREKASIASEMKLDASRGVHSEYKANRLVKMEEQITLVQEELSERIQRSHNKNENNNLSEAWTEEKLSTQEQILENEEKTEEPLKAKQ